MPPASDSAKATTAAPPTPPLTSYRDSALGIFALLLAFRIANALTLRTFFQPDEFFQSLEPAWQLAFGEDSNAWITWEWRTQLRSSLHPGLFAVVYRIAAKLADICGLTLPAKAELLLVTPKVTQAVFAAVLDCYTWKLAEKAYGRGSRTAMVTLALSVCSPWQWFCSTRTLSNCIETTITTVAIYHWPWHWPGTARDSTTAGKDQSQSVEKHLGSPAKLTSCRLRLSLLLAALACILRPTNALIWVSVFVPTLWQATKRQRYVLVREILFCGSAVLACSVASDRLYYGIWTLPPLRFLYFNIAQSLAVFYGKNRADYYFTEGVPLLLTTVLPFGLIGLVRALQGKELRHSPITGSPSIHSPAPEYIHDAAQRRVLIRLAWTCVVTIVALSLISHKEVRFLYPLLPFLHILVAGPLSTTFPANGPFTRKALLISLLLTNILLATFTSRIHQRGVIDVLDHIRHKHEARNNLSTLTQPPSSLSNTTVAFLMPCHSTPWRSHLIYPEISAWALTCEPPLNTPLSDRSSYLDEADEFYIKPGPAVWLRDNMESLDTIQAGGSRSGRHWIRQDPKLKAKYRRAWPQNLVFFEQLEGVLGQVLGGSRYKECWRGPNSWMHDDWRRKGDVVVWCLDGE
ncbi:mannosyltransferase [Parastagonospora nodorum]|nr:mannosyltransferase [Parastagonospora nodorum]KAH5458161.1 mannosyltransferase [Parastagonospora nodorum]KAH5495744.1 mannosyltransferase [Parastagonospora nodorum]KAH6276594.1 mannosyltransferase [Parastagonospora nodorum]KAH6296386.1 mannosyltransferase [Parastagonospora nodorum]